jgi:hypothetical protein
MATRPAIRYYAYSQTLGRKRIPDEHATDTAAITYAQGLGAVNVVREEGPPSKPTAVHVVWSRTTTPAAPLTVVWDVNGTAYLVAKSALEPVVV